MSDVLAAILIVCPIWLVFAYFQHRQQMPCTFYVLQFLAGLFLALAFSLPSLFIARTVAHGGIWRPLLAAVLTVPASFVIMYANKKYKA